MMRRIFDNIVGIIALAFLPAFMLDLEIPRPLFVIEIWIITLKLPMDEWARY